MPKWGMPPRLPALRQPPILFAHRGARAHEQENTIAAFELARRLGSTGLETDAWLSADGVVVLDHDGVVGGPIRRRPIADIDRARLPAHVPTLSELFESCGTGFELSIDVKDPAAAAPIIDIASEAGMLGQTWLCHHDWERVAAWRALDNEVHLVDSTTTRTMKGGPERRAAQLQSAGIDAVNLRENEWTGGLASLFHRFDRYGFGWDAQHERQLDNLFSLGIDGVYSDHVDRMIEAFDRQY
jgi:glycerophosphoryl diester phosphodiesterase